MTFTLGNQKLMNRNTEKRCEVGSYVSQTGVAKEADDAWQRVDGQNDER